MKLQKILCVLLALLCTLAVFAACGETTPPTSDETTGGEQGGEQSGETTSGETTGESVPADLKIVENGASQYRVIISDKQSDSMFQKASELIEAITASTGAVLSVATDFEHELLPESAATDYEILIGTTRDGKYFTPPATELKTTDYLITVIGTRVLILGGSPMATRNGVTHFIKNFVPQGKTDSWTIPTSTEVIYAPELSNTITVMSQNLLNNNTEHANKVNLDSGNPVDQKGQNSIKNRQPRIRELFLGIMPDVIGLQECGNWHDFLKSDSALVNEGYRLLSAQKDSKVSIYYNSNKLEALESGSIWLTEDPENLRCSKEWNSNGNPRLAHFVRFSHKDTGETFIVVNTHIGFENTTLHYNQTRVVAEYCAQLKEKYGDPVVCVGDFNEKKGSDMYEGFVNEFAGGFMEDTKFAATESSTGHGSFHALGSRALDAYAIDQIMVSEEDFLVYTYRVDYTRYGGGDLCYSDHCGIIATMAILPNEE